MARVVFRSEIYTEGDYKAVTPAQLKATVQKLEAEPLVGKPLVRDLTGLRSTRIGGSENRLVYRLVDPDVVEVIAIGRRRADEVYETAAARWG